MAKVSLGPAMPYPSTLCERPPLKQPYARFRGGHPQGRWPAAIFYLLGHPHAVRLCSLCWSWQIPWFYSALNRMHSDTKVYSHCVGWGLGVGCYALHFIRHWIKDQYSLGCIVKIEAYYRTLNFTEQWIQKLSIVRKSLSVFVYPVRKGIRSSMFFSILRSWDARAFYKGYPRTPESIAGARHALPLYILKPETVLQLFQGCTRVAAAPAGPVFSAVLLVDRNFPCRTLKIRNVSLVVMGS
jgi:hypothetical protein